MYSQVHALVSRRLPERAEGVPTVMSGPIREESRATSAILASRTARPHRSPLANVAERLNYVRGERLYETKKAVSSVVTDERRAARECTLWPHLLFKTIIVIYALQSKNVTTTVSFI